MAINRHITHIKSKVANQLPTAQQLYDGEIAINYHKGTETLSIKNDADEVVSFKMALANTSGDSTTVAMSQSAVTSALSSITTIIEDNEEVVATALNDLNTRVNNKSNVSFTQTLTGDTKIGTITIDNVSTDLFCSAGTSIDDTKIAFVGETIASGDSVDQSPLYLWTDGTQQLDPIVQQSIRNEIGAAAASDIPDVSTINSNISTISGNVSTLSGTVNTINSNYVSTTTLQNSYVTGTGGTSTIKHIIVTGSTVSSPSSDTLYIITGTT